MADQYAEIITDTKLIQGIVENLIGSKTVSSIRIAETEFSWITYFLETTESAKNPLVLVDHVKGFEAALTRSLSQEVLFEFKDRVGVPCLFKTKVKESGPGGIWLKIPPSIQRIQRRKYFRIAPPLKSVIIFSRVTGDRETENIQNLGAGGVAFNFNKSGIIKLEDELKNIRLNVPEGSRMVIFQIPRAIVNRVEKIEGGKDFVAVEFEEISGDTRNQIISHVFKVQRTSIRKLGH